MTFRIGFLLFLASTFVSSSSIAQVCKSDGSKRPSLGLVLGGGGARAASEIGVLKVLKEMRIPVDFVAGTSMGSFVGVLYATGYTPEEMEELVKTIEWIFVFSADYKRNDRPFRRKIEDREFMLPYRIGVTPDGLSLPKGAVNAQRLIMTLRNLTIHVSQIDDFNKLPIPYRAIGTDVADGSEMIFSGGDLPVMVATSMSLPGIFPPQEINKKLYVDGGMANNVPISVVKNEGCQRVIAVDVGSLFAKVEDMHSMFDFMDQTSTMLTRGNLARALKLAGPQDLVIHPELSGITTTSYSQEKVEASIERGAKAANEMRDQLAKYSVSEKEYAEFEARRTALRKNIPVIRNIQITNKSPYLDKTLQSEMAISKDKPVNTDEVTKGVERLYAYDSFSSLQYKLNNIPEQKDKKDLELEVVEDPRTRNYMRFGLRLDSDAEGNNNFQFAGNYTMTRINRLAAEWKSNFLLGQTFGVYSEFYQPIEYRLKWFVVPDVSAERRNVYMFDDSDLVGEVLVNSVHGGFAAGRVLDNWGEIRAGLAWDKGDIDEKIGTSSFPIGDYEQAQYFARFTVDAVDYANFPKHGITLGSEWSQSLDILGSDASFKRFQGVGSKFFTFGKETFAIGGAGGTNFDSTLPVQEMFTTGGFLQFSGYLKDSLTVQNFYLGRLVYYHDLTKVRTTIMNAKTYLGGSFELGQVWNTGGPGGANLIPAGSAFVGADTVIGPIILAFGLTEDWQRSVYLFVGRPF